MAARFRFGKSTPAIRAIYDVLLTLPLLVLGVGADDTHHAMAMDHFALVTQLLYRCPHFHDIHPFVNSSIIRPRVRSGAESATRTRSPTRKRTKFARCALGK